MMLAFKNNFSEVEDILDNSLLERRLTTIQINDLTGIILYYRPYTGCIKKKVIELCSALARSLYNLQKSFYRRRKDQAFSFRLSSFL